MATILIVDDRPSNRQFLLTLLGYTGRSLLEAGDGAEGLRLAQSARPDLVVTDILMPTMDGYEFVNRLRADPKLAATPVIFYTATYSEPQAGSLAASCGVRVVLPKPCDSERILAAVSQELGAEGTRRPGASTRSAAASRSGSVSDTIGNYLRDLQGVKVKFDEIVRRSAALRGERDRIKVLSKGFSENVTQLQRVTSRLSALVEVGLAMNAERDPGRLVHVFFAAACDIIDASFAAVAMVDLQEAALRYLFAKNVDQTVFERKVDAQAGLLGTLLAERRTIRGQGIDAGAEGMPAGHPSVSSILALSIASPDRVYGWIYFADKVGANEFTEEDERLASIMAAELGLRYEYAMLYEVVQRHAAALQVEVAERRRVQEELREREAGLHRAQLMAGLAHVVTGAHGEFLTWSDTLAPLTGIETAALPRSTRDWLEHVHPEDHAKFRRASIEAVRSGARTEVEYRLKRGVEWIHLRQVAEPLGTHSGANGTVRWFSTIQDVTEQKRAAQALRESESRFRQLAENIREVFWLTDPDKNEMLYVSPAYEEIWGRSAAALSGSPRDWLDAIHPDDRSRIAEASQTKQVSGDYDEEYRINRPDGSIRWIRDRAFPVFAENRKVVRVVGVAEDITDRKRAADELRESERRFSDLLRNIQLASVMLDHYARITYCNDYLLWLTGWTREEVFGSNWFELFVPAEIRPEQKALFTSLLEDDPAALHHENEILTRSSERRLIRWSNTTLRSSSGAVIGTASIGEDVTERMHMARAVTKAERNYRSIFENSIDGIFQTSLGGRLLSGNPAAARMLGYASAEALVEEVADLGEQIYADAEERRRFLHELEVHGRVFGFETQFKRAQGDVIWVSVSASLEADEEGTRYVLGSMHDITERKLQHAKIERLTRMYAVLSGINAAIVRIRNRDDLFRECCRIVVESGRFALAHVGVVDASEQRLKTVATAGFPEAMNATFAHGQATPEGYGADVLALREKRAIVVNDVQTDSRIRNTKTPDQATRSLAALPLLVAGNPVGVLALHSRETGYFDEEEMRLLLELAGDISFALEHIQKSEQLDHLALYDLLTGLANRGLFLDRLGQRIHLAAQSGDQVAVVLADVERLRMVNDSLGRQVGDAVLKQLAERLANGASRDELARVSADSFAIVLASVEDRAEVTRRVERMWQECLGEPFRIEASDLRISVKSGIALFPEDGTDPETLLRNAEAALRRAKDTGERRVFHTPEMTEETAERLSLENSLRRALDNDEYVLHYQPKLDLETRGIVGVEALIRWQSPERGLVYPGTFLPMLEQTGLILEVGTWVLRRAVLDQRRLLEQGIVPPRIAVNLSLIQLRQHDFVEVLRDAIASGPRPTGIDLELTESLLMANVEDNIGKLRSVRDLGLKIAINDFGTGYSSLAYLARLPVHALKIDRSFVVSMLDNADTMTLVSTIISLAHSMRLVVIAEGVEQEEQAKLLRLLRCDQVQGDLFSRPIPMDELLPLLRVK